MAGVLAAFQAYNKDAKTEAADAARAILDRAEARLGREIHLERQAGTKQQAIADRLGRTREQLRRYERTWRAWTAAHPDDNLDEDLAATA